MISQFNSGARFRSYLFLALATAFGAFIFYLLQNVFESHMRWRKQFETRSVIDPIGDAWMVHKVLALPDIMNVQIEEIYVPSKRFPTTAMMLLQDPDGLVTTALAQRNWVYNAYEPPDFGLIQNDGYGMLLQVNASWIAPTLDEIQDFYRHRMIIRQKLKKWNKNTESSEWIIEETSVSVTLMRLRDVNNIKRWGLVFHSMLYTDEWYEISSDAIGTH